MIAAVVDDVDVDVDAIAVCGGVDADLTEGR